METIEYQNNKHFIALMETVFRYYKFALLTCRSCGYKSGSVALHAVETSNSKTFTKNFAVRPGDNKYNVVYEEAVRQY